MTATIPNLASQYNSAAVEAKWQQWWEENEVFKADPNQDGEPYCVVIPPPNVTGSLHMGHAFESALIDTLVRYHRMLGRNTLWLPGTDHASIAVSTILDNQLKAEGQTRQEIGRDTYLAQAWQWKAESGSTIVNQLRRLGVSVDWSRERFTMDEGLSQAVLEAFVQLYEEGLIYRGNYLVNWCPASQSAVSDLEVEAQEVNGHLWHFRYPLSDCSGYVEVATTRPETMLGDTAVAVNPQDDRYRHLIGKTVTLPIMNRKIPIIADEWVDPSFGTGCVKVTPAHDPNDFEMGQRHQLPLINIMNKDGTLNQQAGPFQGQDRFVARKHVVQRLEETGFLVKVEDYKHTVPYSDRGKVPVEPLLSTQWFVKIRPLAERALGSLDQHHSPRFVPERWTKVYRDWLVNLKDWCISRQLWWGHQIPAWYAVSETGGAITDLTPFVVARTAETAWQQARDLFGPDVQLQQDPDVLDTWFSAGLWPFSTLGWPKQTQDLSTYYPTTTLVTGFDIIFFWVARMTMMAEHFTGHMPFQTVYIHGLVRDENGQKMSKSKNNGINPLVLIDEYGTDALRYTLIKEVAGAGQDISLQLNRAVYNQRLQNLQFPGENGHQHQPATSSPEQSQGKKDKKQPLSESVEASRNFTNKLWNAARFVMINLDGQTPAQLGTPKPEQLELSDRWILSRYHHVVRQTRDYLENYGLGEAAKSLYEFIWGDFCDWYIELVKSRLQGQDQPSKRAAQQTLASVLEGTLKLLHPFMPHITEEIWHTLTQQQALIPHSQQSKNSRTGLAMLACQLYPQVDPAWIDPHLEQQFELLTNTIRTIRNLRAESEIKPGAKIPTVLQSDNERERQILITGETYIKDLAKVDPLTIVDPQAPVAPPPPIPQSPPRPQVQASPSVSQPSQKPIGRSLIVTGVILALLMVLKITQGILSAVNHLPLLGSCFELIGMGYSIWFVIHYLLFAQDRQQLSQHFQDTATDILGRPVADVWASWQQWITVRNQSDRVSTSASASETLATLPVPPPETADTFENASNSDVPVPPLPDRTQAQQMAAGVVGTVQVLIPLAGIVDVVALRAKLEKDLSKVEVEINRLTNQLNNPNFVNKAREEVVQAARDALSEAQKQAEILRDRLRRL
jgi:valyl-tRNA synthetase